MPIAHDEHIGVEHVEQPALGVKNASHEDELSAHEDNGEGNPGDCQDEPHGMIREQLAS